MHINVRDFLAESVGFSRSYSIAGERPQLANVILTEDVNGELSIAKIETGSILAQGQVATRIQLECHRCLRTFTRSVRVSFKQVFAEDPQDDDMPITGWEIDLDPLIEQEIILSLPIKILDRPDCPGVNVGESTPLPAADTSVKARARIIKKER